jgi:hypothetical protein
MAGAIRGPSGWIAHAASCDVALDEVDAIIVRRDAARAARDYENADCLRSELSERFGVKLNDRERVWTAQGQPYPWQQPSERSDRYATAWHVRASALQLISLEALASRTASWQDMPRLQTYRELSKPARLRVARELGRAAAERLAAGTVLCCEKPYLAGFVEGFAEATAARDAVVPFVLLAINGGDEPLGHAAQARIASMRGLAACYANNLHAPRLSGLFWPLPIGVLASLGAASAGEALLRSVAAQAPPWEARDRRLLVAPMRLNSRLRRLYLRTLSAPEYADIVRIVSGRLPPGQFLRLIATHRATLSPAGRGSDCFRTWQALAVGTAPLVPEDATYDSRLLQLGPTPIPPPHALTPQALGSVLDGLCQPASQHVRMDHWEAEWHRAAGGGAAE